MSNNSERPEHASGGNYSTKGKSFSRDMNYIPTRLLRDVPEGADAVAVEPGRYRLIAARACPWANRTLIVRRLLGLEDALSVGMPGPVHDADSWTFDLDPGGVDPVLGIPKLKDAYLARDPEYPRGITVPAIADTTTGAVVTNDFNQITLDFSTQWTEFQRDGSQYYRLFADGDSYAIGTMTAHGMDTPGHTPACVSYRIGDAVFVGDTLFMPDYGTARADSQLFETMISGGFFAMQRSIFALNTEPSRQIHPDSPFLSCAEWPKNMTMRASPAEAQSLTDRSAALSAFIVAALSALLP